MSLSRRSLRRIRKSNSTGTMRIANIRPLSRRSLRAPLNLTTINVESYKICGRRKEANNFISPRKNLREKISDTFRKESSRKKSLNEVDTYHRNKMGISVIVKNEEDNYVDFSPSNIPSWPVATSTPKEITDPLGKPDKHPLKFALDVIHANKKSPDMLKEDAGHTPPVPNKWQVRIIKNPRRAERLAELNKGMEHNTKISSTGKHVKSAGSYLSARRHATYNNIITRMKGKASPTKNIKGRLYTRDAGCTPPRTRGKEKRLVNKENGSNIP